MRIRPQRICWNLNLVMSEKPEKNAFAKRINLTYYCPAYGFAILKPQNPSHTFPTFPTQGVENCRHSFILFHSKFTNNQKCPFCFLVSKSVRGFLISNSFGNVEPPRREKNCQKPRNKNGEECEVWRLKLTLTGGAENYSIFQEFKPKETTLERADFTLQLLMMFVTSEKETYIFIVFFLSSFCQLFSPQFQARAGWARPDHERSDQPA